MNSRCCSKLTDCFEHPDKDWVYPVSADTYPAVRETMRAGFHPLPFKMCNMPVGGNNGSARSLDQAIGWLDKCRDTHPDCGPADPSFCPSRLVELRSDEGEAPKVLHVKLVETKHIRTGIEYACLSHCWGNITPVCVTNKHSMEENLAGIPWSNIPQTFQDAMILTWRLRLKYIWIDCLCIIQEDNEDWRREAATMASIYSNSSITISATSSANCLQGLYQTDPAHVRVHELKLFLPGQRSARALVHPILDHVDWMGHSQLYIPGSIGPKLHLLQRAWFFQEWHLSPRLLHFAEGEIIWQCGCGSLSQYEALIGHPFPFPASNEIESTTSTDDSPPPQLMTQRLWFNTVEAYSSLQLTFREKDVLAAISGVAKKTEHFKRGDTYAAGLWLENMAMGLCWISFLAPGRDEDRPFDVAKRPTRSSLPSRLKEWAAPSWSWASANGAVSYRLLKFNFHFAPDPSFWDKKCDVNEVTCILAGEDTTGPLKEASLIISGLATRCILEYSYESEERNIGRPDYCIIMGRIGPKRSRAFFWPDHDPIQPGEHHLPPGSSLECVLLLGRIGYYSNGEEDTYTSRTIWLILNKTKRKKDAYERVGLLETTSPAVANEIEAESSRSTFVIV